jgi:hypothetical protein
MFYIMVILTAIFAIAAEGAELPKEGKYDTTACYTGTSNDIAFSKTIFASTYELVGTNLSNPPGGMFNKTSFRCVGSNIILSGKLSVTTFCELVDRDGDNFLTRLIISDGTIGEDDLHGTNETTVIAGTGKYEGMTRTATNENYAVTSAKPGTFQRCGRVAGTYKLK